MMDYSIIIILGIFDNLGTCTLHISYSPSSPVQIVSFILKMALETRLGGGPRRLSLSVESKMMVFPHEKNISGV